MRCAPSLAFKLWAIKRKSHVMLLVTKEGLALFSGLNISPRKGTSTATAGEGERSEDRIRKRRRPG
jgi:hypothetical protein